MTNPFRKSQEPEMVNVEVVALDSEGNAVSDPVPAVMVVQTEGSEVIMGLLNSISITLHPDKNAYSGYRVTDAETGQVLVDPKMEGY